MFCINKHRWLKSQRYFWIQTNSPKTVPFRCTIEHFLKTELCSHIVLVNRVQIGIKSNFVMWKAAKIFPIFLKKWNSHQCHGHMTTKDCFITWVFQTLRRNFINDHSLLQRYDQEGKTDGSETVANENQKLYYHRLGESQDQDVLVAEFPEHPARTMFVFWDCS